MPWGAVAAAVVGAYSSSQSSKAAAKGAKGQQAADQAALAEQARQYDQSRADQMPWLQAGQAALARQNAFLNGDTSGFDKSPDYLFRMSEGMKGLDRSAASRGRLYSGGYGEDLTKFAQGTAAQGANDYWNKLAGQAGQGQTTASGLGSLGANYASNIGQLYQDSANARASSYNARAQNNGDLAAGIGGAFSNWYGNNSARNGGGTGWYLGSKPGKG